MAFKPWRAFPGWLLLWALNLFSAVALIYEGYNQGVMGFVNGSAGYIQTVGIGGADGEVTDTTKQGRRDEAVKILAKIRGDLPFDHPTLVAELEQLDEVIHSSGHKRYQFHNVTFGRYSGKLHLGRRVALAIEIMMMMEWTGILAITVYANTLFQQAGFSANKAAWLSGHCNTFGIVGTAASVLTVDRFGRRVSFYFGFFIQGAVLLISVGLSRLGQLHPDNAGAYGAAAAAMVFIYTFLFAQTVLMIAFIYPTEIWPQEIRAFGNSYGVFGWAVGYGVTTLVIPSMFAALGWKTLVVFGSFNFGSLPLVYLFFPETNGRTLEEINLLFAAQRPVLSANEMEFRRMLDAAGGNVAVAERRLMEELDELAGEKRMGSGEGYYAENKLSH